MVIDHKLKDRVFELINSSQKIVIVPSYRIDPDAIGSALAIKHILKKIGKSSEIIYSGTNLDRLEFLPGSEDIKFQDLFTVDYAKYDLAFFLDGCDLMQFADQNIHGTEILNLPETLKIINLDHHESREKFSTIEICCPTASSTCEVVYEVFSEKVEIDKEIAECLFAAIAGDTGGFKFINTSPNTFRIAANLLETGINLPDINTYLFSTNPFKIEKLVGKMLSKATLNAKWRYAYVTISEKDWKNDGYTLEEADKATLLARDVGIRTSQEVDFVFSLRETEPGSVKGSFRSRIQGKYDFAKLANIIDANGGGHKESAGFFIRNKTLEESLKVVQNAIKLHLKEVATI